MFLTVKLLLGRKCSLKVSGQESVAMLKKLVSEHLHVPEEQQHLLFRGQLLDDDKCLSDYCIGPNSSINVIVRPLDKVAADKALQPQDKAQPLWQQLDRVLAKHFGPQDAKAVLQQLRQEHEECLQRVSLEALEQLACHLLTEQQCPRPAPQSPEREAGGSRLVTGGKEEAGSEWSPCAGAQLRAPPIPGRGQSPPDSGCLWEGLCALDPSGTQLLGRSSGAESARRPTWDRSCAGAGRLPPLQPLLPGDGDPGCASPAHLGCPAAHTGVGYWASASGAQESPERRS
ncbi:ubiquitin-like protein 4B [Erethizon dorsatum]